MTNYEEDFSFYLKFTNEKRVLAQEIINLFKKLKVKSVLDIGAGNGDLSSLLVKKVEKYITIEPQKEFAKLLRDKEISVIEKTFPCYTGEEQYDFILCSHSLPSLRRDYEPFLKEAFEKLKKDGNLLLITYIGKDNDWGNLLRDINVKPFEDTSARYFERKDFLKQFGKIKEWFVFSRLESSSIDNFIKALSFVASGGEKEKREIFLSKTKEICDILNKKYYDKKSEKYFFPFKHVFLMVNKK
ncbi:MAG: methyltransferase domain-containing protein [Candidatus Pacearchaeota archaeon]|nr:methyltransferase domain-containing protein [Candidatus Pacearchaeota archaeon]